jgi:hypothetical protein
MQVGQNKKIAFGRRAFSSPERWAIGISSFHAQQEAGVQIADLLICEYVRKQLVPPVKIEQDDNAVLRLLYATSLGI